MPERLEFVIPGPEDLPASLWSDLEIDKHLKTAVWLLELAGANFEASSLTGFLASIKVDTGPDPVEPHIGSNP